MAHNILACKCTDADILKSLYDFNGDVQTGDGSRGKVLLRGVTRDDDF